MSLEFQTCAIWLQGKLSCPPCKRGPAVTVIDYLKAFIRPLQWRIVRQLHNRLVLLKYRDSTDDFYRYFDCNICGHGTITSRDHFYRETRSCLVCGSAMRERAFVEALSQVLFGESFALPDFPNDKSIVGRGLSDELIYARPLEKKLDYTNSYFHKAPQMDITNIPAELEGTLDFLLSADVFEHVNYPPSIAFGNTYRLLKPGGHLVLSVPYRIDVEETEEHFGELGDTELVKRDGDYVFIGTTPDGERKEFTDLVFHGGKGTTVEMRIFSLKSVIAELESAGFVDIRVRDESVPERGIYWLEKWSLPITARKPG